jgi:hypothetical protein
MNKARTTRKDSRRKYTRRKSKKNKTKRKLRGGMNAGDAAGDAAAFAAVTGHGKDQDKKVSLGKDAGSDGESSDDELFKSTIGEDGVEEVDEGGRSVKYGEQKQKLETVDEVYDPLEPQPQPEPLAQSPTPVEPLRRSSGRVEEVYEVDEDDDEDDQDVHVVPPEPRPTFSPGNLFIRGKADQGEYDAALSDEKDNDRDVFNSSVSETRKELLAMPNGTLFEYFTSREGSHNNRVVNLLAAMAMVNIGMKQKGEISPCRKNEETGGYDEIEGAKKIPFDKKFIDDNHIIIIDASFRLETMFTGKRYLFSVMGSNLQFAFSDFNHENMQLTKTTEREAVGWHSEQQYILSLGEDLPDLKFHWYQIDKLISEISELVDDDKVDEACREKIKEARDLHEEYKTTWSAGNAGLRMESLARGSASALGAAVGGVFGGVFGTAADVGAKAAAAVTPQVLQDASTSVSDMVSTAAAAAPAMPGLREEKTVKLESNDDIEEPDKSLTKFILSLLLRLIRCGFLEQVFSNLGVSTNKGGTCIITKQNFAAALISRAVEKGNIVEATVDTSMGAGRAAWYSADDFVANLLLKMGVPELEKLRTELGKELLADRMHEWKRANQSQYKARAFQYAAGAAAGIAEYLQWEKARFAARVAEGVAKATVAAHESGAVAAAATVGKVRKLADPSMYAAHATHTRVILTNAIKSAGFLKTFLAAATLKLPEDFINHIKAGREARELYNSLCAELVGCTPDSEDISGVEKDSVDVRRTFALMKTLDGMSPKQKTEFVEKLLGYGHYTGNIQMAERLQNSVGLLGDAGEIMALQEEEEEEEEDDESRGVDSLETVLPGSEPEPEYDWKVDDERVD